MVLAVKQTENETQVFQKTNKELELGPWKPFFLELKLLFGSALPLVLNYKV